MIPTFSDGRIADGRNERLQQNRFSQMSDTIIGRVDEMSNRIDDLEKSIQDLMVQADIEPVDDSSAEGGDGNTGSAPPAEPPAAQQG
ncbi:unnamed protein product [Pylaiella littoralis]